MLTRWAIALQSFDFTVRHKPGRLHVVPDTLSRLFAFDHQQQLDAPQLTPICRNVPEDPALHSNVPRRPYQVSSDRSDNLQPVKVIANYLLRNQCISARPTCSKQLTAISCVRSKLLNMALMSIILRR